jgi:hypothetical protein
LGAAKISTTACSLSTKWLTEGLGISASRVEYVHNSINLHRNPQKERKKKYSNTKFRTQEVR